MEKSRAIELLEHLAWDRDIDRNPYGDAINIAIDALKAQLSQERTTKDAISRQAALDALDFEIVHITAYRDGKNEGNPLAQYNKGLEDGKKAIEALPSAQPEPPWIPVSERLPEKTPLWKTIGYLATVTCDSWKESRTMYVKWETTTVRGKEVSRWTFDNRLFPSEWCVIAWMPLPEVYKPNK